jgi:hypothetical protein
MHVVIGIGGGAVVGLLFLLQSLGMAHWCPPGLFMILHFPSSILVFTLSQGQMDLGKPLSPYVLVLQWTFLGALLGVLLHLKQRSNASVHLNDFSKGQAIPSAPKTSVRLVRVICAIVALLFLLSLLFWGWVLLSPHR